MDKPESVQTVIRFYLPGPVYADPNRVKLTLLNTIFGGSFTSRLNQNLREQHGYTYGAGSRYFMDPQIGFFLAYANVQAEVTGEALKEFLKEFASIRSGDISDEEVSKARASFRTDLVQDYENLGAVLQSAVTLLRNRRPFDGPAADLKASAVERRGAERRGQGRRAPGTGRAGPGRRPANDPRSDPRTRSAQADRTDGHGGAKVDGRRCVSG